jgi:hypothetical protein
LGEGKAVKLRQVFLLHIIGIFLFLSAFISAPWDAMMLASSLTTQLFYRDALSRAPAKLDATSLYPGYRVHGAVAAKCKNTNIDKCQGQLAFNNKWINS